MKIHHNTVKKAAKFGIKLVVVEGEVEARKDGRTLASHLMGNVALEQAISVLTADVPAGKLKAAKKNPAKARKPRKVQDEDGDDDSEDEGNEDGGLEALEDQDAEGASEDGEGDEEGEGKSIVKHKYKARYKPFKMTCGDDLAALIKQHLLRDNEDGDVNIDPAKLKKFAQANGCWDPNYVKLNVGMQRMNVGNRLRAKVRRDKHPVVWA